MGSSDLKLELNKKEAEKSAYYRDKGNEVVLPKEAEPEEIIIDKKQVISKLEKITKILNSAIGRIKVFISPASPTAQKKMDKKDKKMCTPPPPSNPEKRKAKQKQIKDWQEKQKRRTILQDRTPPSPEQLEKIHRQKGELRKAKQKQIEDIIETLSSGEFDPTIRVDGCTFEHRELPSARVLTDLSIKAYKEAESKNKWNGTSINDALLWLISEVLELYRAKERQEGSIEEEMEIDIGKEVERKMRKNANRE